MTDVEYYAMDSNNNKTDTKKIRIFRDIGPPTITYTIEDGFVAEDGSIILGINGKIIFTITDDYGLGKFYYRIDAGEWKEVPLSGKRVQIILTL